MFRAAAAEIAAYIVLGQLILKMSVSDAAILGCVMAAVSPAVVVPRMLRLKETGYGTDKGIPDMIMTGASADDIFVIVLFTSLTTMATDGTFSRNIVWQVPVSILLGIGAGVAVGFLFVLFVKKIHMRDSIKVILILSFSFLFVGIETAIEAWVPFSGLLAVIAFAAVIFAGDEVCAKRLSLKFSKLWVFAEILLFAGGTSERIGVCSVCTAVRQTGPCGRRFAVGLLRADLSGCAKVRFHALSV